MSAFGWITAARRTPLATWLRRSHARKNVSRKASLGLESLERIELLSHALLPKVPRPTVHVQTAPLPVSSMSVAEASPLAVTQTISAPLVNVSPQLTNFTASFTPPITLFDPALGTLTAVHLTEAVALTSVIKSQNTSSSSAADITPFIKNGNYQITGLPVGIARPLVASPIAAVHVPINSAGPPFNFTGPTTVVFGFPADYSNTGEVQKPPVNVTDSTTVNFTSPTDLAFWTASAGRTTLTPQLTVNAQAGADAPNGNLQTDVRTLGGGQILVTYEYTPPCPTVVRLVRFGIHQQPTTLQLFFNGAVNVADAQNTANYTVIVPNKSGSFTGPGTSTVPISSAVYDQATNSVVLTTARRLNVHHLFQLQVKLPCNNGNTVVIEFGGKQSLGGFLDPHHGNRFIPVSNGRIVRA